MVESKEHNHCAILPELRLPHLCSHCKTLQHVTVMSHGPFLNKYLGHETKKFENLWASQRDRAGKDVQHMRVMKDENGNVMVSSETVLKR